MAAYAAVVSVINIMDQIRNHRHHSFSFDKKQMETLRENVDFLVHFLECCSDGGSNDGEALESQIATAAYAAEDVLESHVVDQIHAGSTLNGDTTSCFLLDLQKVIEDIDSIMKLAMEVKAQRGFRDQLTKFSRPATSSRPLTIGKNVMVDYDDELIQLMEMLTRQHHNRQIIPIVGMGGIGKTTFARNVYERSVIVQHFDVRLWATVSQEYSAEKILLQLLSLNKESMSGTAHELGERLHKTLSGRRYLVVLDDMWSVEAWDEKQLFLPHNSNGSSIVITTRLLTMADHLGSKPFVMKFLAEITSWKLLREKAFGEEGCPLELEEIGKKIAKNCKGLPLSIVVIGGHLRKSSRTKEYWEVVVNDINSVLDSGDDSQCLNILSLSYNYLPVYLKPCFLYMGSYPEDMEIVVSELIELWVAEGFLKINKLQSSEEVAEGYLRDLIDRNLILVTRHTSSGEVYSCNIHDLLRQLSLRVAEKEKFFCVLNNHINSQAIHTERRVIVNEDTQRNAEIFDALRSAQLIRSLKWKRGKLLFDLRLLRILSEVNEIGGAFDYFQHVNMRYIDLIRNGRSSCVLPSSISMLWNLQTLKCNAFDINGNIPSEIWYMPHLRHLRLPAFGLPDPPSCHRSNPDEDFVLRNLRTLTDVKNFQMSEEVCRRLPNITKLSLYYCDLPTEGQASLHYSPCNLNRFEKLESLRLYFEEAVQGERDFARSFTFSSSLRKLLLQGCGLDWEDLTTVAALPYLEVLYLNPGSVKGPEWSPVEGGFRSLKLLYIGCDDLIFWNAGSSHFPVLEELQLKGLSKLEEVPVDIGEIPTLRVMKLEGCSVSATISAMEIVVEQESAGNEDLRVNVYSYTNKERENFKEEMEELGLRSDNIVLEPSSWISVLLFSLFYEF